MTRRSTYHHGDLRQALIDAATAMLADGNHTFTLRELARQAGVSAAAPYNHFADKSELIAAVAVRGLDRLRARLERSVTQTAGKSPQAQVTAMIDSYVRFASEFPSYFELMFGPELATQRHEALHEQAERTKGILRRLLQQWQAAGVIAHGDVDEQVRLTWSTAHGVATLLKGPLARDVRTRDARRRLARAAARMVMKGLAPAR